MESESLRRVAELTIAVIGGGGITKLMSVFLSRKTVDAEAEKVKAEAKDIHISAELKIAGTAANLVVSLQSQLERVLERLNTVEQEVDELRKQNTDLTLQVERLEQKNKTLSNRCETLSEENKSLRSRLKDIDHKE